jgi:hypothetical protein
MRLDIERQTSRMRDEPAIRPAMALLRKLGDGKRKAR